MATRPSGNNYQPLSTSPEEPEDNRSLLERFKSDISRITAGNIDDPKSEAYKRYGAGRNAVERDESVSVNEPRAVARPSMRTTEDNMYSDYGATPGYGSAGTGETIKPSARVTPSKPVASKPASKKEVGESVSVNQPKTTKKSESETSDIRGVTSETRTPRFTPNEPPVATHKGPRSEEKQSKAPVDETKLSLSERMKLSRERSKGGSGPTDTRSVSERVRSTFGMKSGGSVSSASRRADGIATKGKTRGKIC